MNNIHSAPILHISNCWMSICLVKMKFFEKSALNIFPASFPERGQTPPYRKLSIVERKKASRFIPDTSLLLRLYYTISNDKMVVWIKSKVSL